MNKKKIEVIFNMYAHKLHKIAIHGEVLERGSDYVHLSHLLQTNPSMESKRKRRLRLGWSVLGKQANILKDSLPITILLVKCSQSVCSCRHDKRHGQ